jgi:hypothetical protein
LRRLSWSYDPVTARADRRLSPSSSTGGTPVGLAP